MAGKRQHYVPRLLQRGFLHDPADLGERTWLHRVNAAPKLVGIRDIGVEDWFYSRRSADGEPTLDDAITELEADLQHDVAAFRTATLGTRVSGAIAAPLVAHLATRTAYIRATMTQLLGTFLEGASARIGTPEGLRRMLSLDAHEPSDLLRKAVSEAVADLPLDHLGVPPVLAERLMLFMARETAPSLLEAQSELLGPLLTTLARDARDKIREGHNRALTRPPEQTGWAEVLSQFAWRLEPASHAILPDCVALAREDAGDFIPFLLSSGAAAQAVLLPLAPDRILVGTKVGATPVDLSGFNLAAAAACDSFFIAATPAPAELVDLIGTRPGQAVREVVQSVFDELDGPGASTGESSSAFATPGTVRAFSYPVICVGVGDEDAARDIAQVVDVIMTELSRTLPLSDLDGVTFAADYADALRNLDRGDPDLPPIETDVLAYGVGAARCVEVVRDGVRKDHIVLAGWIGAGLLTDDDPQRLHCAAIVAKELAKLGHGVLYAREAASAMPPDDVVRQLYGYASQAPSAYFSSRASAFICLDQGEIYAELVQTSLGHARDTILEARLAYRISGDLDALLAEVLPCVSAILGHAADWLGHRDGFPPRDLERLRLHLLERLRQVEALPAAGAGIDWRRLASDAGVDADLMLLAKDALRPGLEALRREIAARPRPKRQVQRPTPRPEQADHATATTSAGRRGRPRKPVVTRPAADSDIWDDPALFHEALALHMRRHGDTSVSLTRAILAPGETLETSTIVTWRNGQKAPRSVASLNLLRRIERRYGLPAGYFQAKLPHPARAATGHPPSGVSASEMRRLAWHLPDDFADRPAAEREEILEWVRRVVISGSTEYRRYQADAMKLRYAVRFPELQSKLLRRRPARVERDLDDETTVDPSDPELLSGVVRAPPQLASEMAALVSFKTATLTALGYQRRGVWGQETAAQKIEHLGLMFGALAASSRGAVRGYGAPLRDLTFGLLIFPSVWDWYVQWRERRRGFYTSWEVDMLQVAVALTGPETGWLTQTPELAERLRPIPGLVSKAEIDAARDDWPAACAKAHAHTLARATSPPLPSRTPTLRSSPAARFG